MILELKGSRRRLWPRFWLREWLFATNKGSDVYAMSKLPGYVRTIWVTSATWALVFHCRRRPDIESVTSPAPSPR